MYLRSTTFILAVLGLASAFSVRKLGRFPYAQDRVENDGTRIVAGTNALLKEVPYQVRVLHMENENTFLCGGSLISAEWVVTAAHCISTNVPPEDYDIIGGDLSFSTPEEHEQLRHGLLIHVHPLYVDILVPLSHDIAIIKVGESFELNDYLDTVCVPPLSYRAAGLATISGWGTTSSGGSIPDDLQIAEVEIISDSSCQTQYLPSLLAPSDICAGPGPNGQTCCNGDSGGPLAKNGILYGAVSRGKTSCNAATIFTEIAYFSDWISEKAGTDVICT